jgi:hypothetical protein
MRRAVLGAVLVFALAVPAATAKTTRNFTFQSSGKAVQFGVLFGTGADGTYEDFPVTIKPDERNGAFTVGLLWNNPADDWDLYVYQKIGNQTEQVGSSTSGAPGTEEQATIQPQGEGPVEAGQYIVRVQNYSSADPNFRGVGKFSPFTEPNRRPRARLKVRRRASSRKRVRLNASRSSDPDGRIVSYAFDLDGDGSMERVSKKPRIRHRFRPGRHRIGLRVTDNQGARAYTNATINVYKAKRKRRKR